ncbi:MAG: tetratricopeptide repeat protein [Sphingobacteriaceae bacterium]
MKITYLITGILGLVFTTSTYAQKSELSSAKSEFDKYESMRGNKNMAKMAETSFKSAKESIDKASVHDKTASLPLTYALKGAIYAALAVDDTVAATSAPNFVTANEALKKAKELDTKAESKDLIHNGYLTLAQYKLNSGVKEYSKEQYDIAYSSFNYYREVLPEDTNAIYYTALSASNAKMYEEAITNYTKLLTTNYSGNARVYSDLSVLYLIKKDTANAIKTIGDGTAKYPNNIDLAKREIEIHLQAGKQKEVVGKIENAIKNDPKNKVLYYYAGITYSEVKDAIKAEEMYRKALEIDPDYFEANLNLGFLLLNPAIDAFNAASNLPTNKQKEYDEALAKVGVQFEKAKQYVLKAAELKPESADALNNLKTYYLGRRDLPNANATQKKIDDLKK